MSLLDIERSETPRLLLYREEAYLRLYRQNSVSLLYIERRERLLLYTRESVFPLYREERDYFSRERRERLSFFSI